MEVLPEIQKLNDGLPALGLELGESVKRSRDIEVASDAIWTAIAQPGSLTQYHPFCATNPVDRWPGEGSRDQVIYYSGVAYQRDFVTWLEGVGYDLELGPRPPHKTARVAWRIEALTAARSALSIEVTPYLQADLPEARKLAYQERAFGNTIATYLESVLQGVAYFVTSGQAVRRNQFGSHSVYST